MASFPRLCWPKSFYIDGKILIWLFFSFFSQQLLALLEKGNNINEIDVNEQREFRLSLLRKLFHVVDANGSGELPLFFVSSCISLSPQKKRHFYLSFFRSQQHLKHHNNESTCTCYSRYAPIHSINHWTHNPITP